MIPTVLTAYDFEELNKAGRLGNFGGYVLSIYGSYLLDGELGDKSAEKVFDTLEEGVRALLEISYWTWDLYPIRAEKIDTAKVPLVALDKYRGQPRYKAFITKLDGSGKEQKLNTHEVRFLIEYLTGD